MFHVLSFTTSLCFPCTHYVFLFTFLDSAVTLDPSLLYFAYCTQIPFSYPAPVHPLVSIYTSCARSYNLRTNITCFSLVSLSEVLWNARILRLGSGRLLSPLLLTSFPPARVLVWVVDSYPPDSSFRYFLSMSGSGRI